MSLPVIESISNEIINRLENIQLKNGYPFSAASVEVLERDADTYDPSPLDIVIELQEEAENEEMSYPGNPPAVAFDALFMIHGYYKQIDHDDVLSNVNAGVTRHQMQAAIQKAVATSVAGDWVTWEAKAVTTSLTDKVKFQGPGHDGITVEMLVTYRTSEADPYTVR